MSSYFSYMSDPEDSKRAIERRIRAGNIIRAIVGAALVIFAVIRAIPADIFSTALWYDNTVYRLVWSDTNQFFTFTNAGRYGAGISEEGVVFAIMLSLVQIAMSIRAATLGDWSTKGHKTLLSLLFRPKLPNSNVAVKASDINWEKVTYFSIAIAISIFDTATDTLWKAGAYGNIITMFILSYLYNNLGSEWALIEGLRLAYVYGIEVFSPTTTTKSKQQFNPKHRGGNNQARVSRSKNQAKSNPQRSPNSRSKSTPQGQSHMRRVPQPGQSIDEVLDEIKAIDGIKPPQVKGGRPMNSKH